MCWFSESGRRVKRATSSNPDHDTCTLHLVADYHFYRSVGGNSDVTSANYLVGIMTLVWY